MEPQNLHQRYQSTLTQKEMIYDLLGAAAADIRRGSSQQVVYHLLLRERGLVTLM